MYGIIDGFTASYNTDCRDALKTTIDASFRLNQYKLVMVPTNTAKFQLAGTKFTTGTSNVYAYCDFTTVYSEFAKIQDYHAYENYIKLASRYAGAYFSAKKEFGNCIIQGEAAGLGYDVGLCRGKYLSLLLDTVLWLKMEI